MSYHGQNNLMRGFKSFKSKTYFAFGSIAVLSIVLLLTLFRLFSVLDGLDSYVLKVTALKNQIHNVKDNENKMFLFDTKSVDFIKSGNSQYVTSIDSLQNNMINEIGDLLDHNLTEEYDLNEDFTTISEAFQQYYSLLEEAKSKIQKRGVDNLGVSGQLNSQLEGLKVKALLSEYEVLTNEIINSIYNFYLVESEENAIAIEEKIKEHLSNSGAEFSLEKPFKDLLEKFTQYASLSREIGMRGDQGIRAELIANSEKLLNECVALESVVKSNTENEKSLLYIGFAVLASLQVLIAIYFGIKMSTLVVARLNKIRSNIGELSAGVFPSRIEVSVQDELGEISSSVNELTDRIEYAANYAREIGKGNLSEDYNPDYSEDAIAQAIMEMREKLKANAEIDHLRTWRTEGMAKFAGILQENKDNSEALCYEVVCNLVKYVGANQGVIYTVEDKDDIQVLKAQSGYAYDREKFLEIEIERGDGLIGETWKEGETVVLTEIPEDYFEITSGLGTASPTCIVILPLIYNEEIFGVIEMASFKVLNESEIEFLEELGQSVAGTLSGTKVNQRTKALLKDSQKMQDEMKEQEEMMRQNMEEMQATQDTFEERERVLTDEINKLKNLLGS